MMIFVLNKDRRNWSAQRIDIECDRRKTNALTKRYLLIVNEPELEDVIKGHYSKAPNSVYPHESGERYMFYCSATESSRNEQQFVRELFKVLEKRYHGEESLNQLEIHHCETNGSGISAYRYKSKSGTINRTQLW